MDTANILGLEIDWNEKLNSKLRNKYEVWEKRIVACGGIWEALDEDLRQGLLLHKKRLRIIPKKYKYLRTLYHDRVAAIQFELSVRERRRKIL